MWSSAWSAWGFAVVTALAAPAAQEAEPEAEVVVEDVDGVYTVSARFHAPQPVGIVREVLEDYDGIPRFLPHVTTSEVIERTADRAVVRQEIQARYLFFSRDLHLELEIVERPNAITFHDRDGRSFDRYEGEWRFSGDERGTDVTYRLVADPASGAPGFVLDGLFERDSKDMIRRIQAEIAARARSISRGER